MGVSDGNTRIPSASGLQERATLHGDGDVLLCLSLVLLSVTVPVSVCLYTRLSVSVSMSLSLGLCAWSEGQARPSGQQTDIAILPDGGGAFGFSTALSLSLKKKKNLLSKGPKSVSRLVIDGPVPWRPGAVGSRPREWVTCPVLGGAHADGNSVPRGTVPWC